MHSHSSGGHHHGIDMSHPVLALSTMIVSISVKEGYQSEQTFDFIILIVVFVSLGVTIIALILLSSILLEVI